LGKKAISTPSNYPKFNPGEILNGKNANDGIEFQDKHLSFFGSYLYLNAPERSHLVYQEMIRDFKQLLKHKDDEIDMLRNELELVSVLVIFS
jgi:hypothetical protein